jgi:hypothetical protein
MRWHLDEVFLKIKGELCSSSVPLTTKVTSWRPCSLRGADKAAALKLRKRVREIRQPENHRHRPSSATFRGNG